MHVCIVVALLALAIHTSNARVYIVNVIGTAPNDASPNLMGVGCNWNETSSTNAYTWMAYLKTQQGRQFIQPLATTTSDPALNTTDWRVFTSNIYDPKRLAVWGNQFGKSFSNNTVDSKLAFQTAVQEIRSISFTRSNPNFLDWLRIQPGINWALIVDRVTYQSKSINISTSQSATVRNLIKRNYATQVLWDIRCDNLSYVSTDRNDPQYWMERWETYRLFYFGGRHLALIGTNAIEAYNEPDHDKCMEAGAWIDDTRIRATALRDAYDDHSKVTGVNIDAYIIAGTTAHPWDLNIGPATMEVLNKPFPYEEYQTRDFTFADAYSFHRYGSFSSDPNCTTFGPNCKNGLGYGLENTFQKVEDAIRNATQGALLPIWITEFNCYMNALMSNVSHSFFNYRHTMDEPSTAACIGSHVLNLINQDSGPAVLTFFKGVQSMTPARMVKNGLYYTSSYPPYDITGTTLSGEAYRMLLRKIPRTRHNTVYSFAKTPDLGTDDRYNIFAVDDDKAYYIYSTNEEWVTQNVTLDVARFPAANGGDLVSTVLNAGNLPSIVVSASTIFPDGTASYGEVVQYGPFNTFKPTTDTNTTTNTTVPSTSPTAMAYSMPPASFYMFTVPKKPVQRTSITPSDAVSVRPGNNGITNYDKQPLIVTTSPSTAEDTSVALIKFEIPPKTPTTSDHLVTAVLFIDLQNIDGGDSLTTTQVLTLNALDGTDSKWKQSIAVWNFLPFLKPLSNGVGDTSFNFINWQYPGVRLAGMLSVSPSDVGRQQQRQDPNAAIRTLAVDVSEVLMDMGKTNAVTFIISRLMRMDETRAGPADALQGAFTLTNPRLVIEYV